MQPRSQMIGQAVRQCDQRERGVCPACGRKDVAADKVKILDIMDSAVRINHTVVASLRHSGGAEVMIRVENDHAFKRIRLLCDAAPCSKLLKKLDEDFLSLSVSRPVKFAKLPVQNESS